MNSNGIRHETTGAQKRGARYETIDEPHASRLASKTPRSSGLTSHAPWPKVKLGEVLSIKHGYAFEGDGISSEDNGVVLVTPGNFQLGGGFKESNKKFFTKAYPESYVLKAGDFIVTMTDLSKDTDTLGYSAKVPSSDKVYLHNQRIGLVDVFNKTADREFVYWFMRTRAYQRTIAGCASGVSVKHTSPQKIYSAEIPLPPLHVQRRIADILSAYDDLIENNRRRIAILEETARLTYRKWFGGAKKSDWGMRRETIDDQGLGVRHETIDDPHVLSLASKAPRVTRLTSHAQSRAATLGEICREVRRGVSLDVVAPDTPYIGLEHMPRRSISLCEWEFAQKVSSTKLAFEAGDILFGKIRPYFHKVGITFVDGVASSDAIVIKPLRPELHAYVLMTVSSDAFVAAASQGMKEGSKMPRADWKQLLNYSVAMPDDDTLAEFNKVLNPILEQLKTLCFSIRNLAAARDMLLPRLMKGGAA